MVRGPVDRTRHYIRRPQRPPKPRTCVSFVTQAPRGLSPINDLGAHLVGLADDTAARYQSKIGSRKWLRPSLRETIDKLAASGAKSILVVPVAFVSDHVETLSEINIEAREQARENGIEQFEMMPGLNDNPVFIQALAGLVDRALGAERPRPRRDAFTRAASGAG